MKAYLLLALAGVLATQSLAVQAQTPPIKPGLWQVQSERDVDGKKAPDMSESLKSMSPEARKRMEEMMKQHGVDMSSGPGQMKMCMTRDTLDQGRWQGEQTHCKTDFTTRSSSLWKWHSVCEQPPSVTDGEAAFVNAESYTVKSRTTSTRRGQARVSNITLNAKWLSADCGDIKPISPPPKRSAAAKP